MFISPLHICNKYKRWRLYSYHIILYLDGNKCWMVVSTVLLGLSIAHYLSNSKVARFLELNISISKKHAYLYNVHVAGWAVEEKKCSDRSMVVLFQPSWNIISDRPNKQLTDQQTDGLIGKLHFQYCINNEIKLCQRNVTFYESIPSHILAISTHDL